MQETGRFHLYFGESDRLGAVAYSIWMWASPQSWVLTLVIEPQNFETMQRKLGSRQIWCWIKYVLYLIPSLHIDYSQIKTNFIWALFFIVVSLLWRWQHERRWGHFSQKGIQEIHVESWRYVKMVLMLFQQCTVYAAQASVKLWI